MAPKKKKGKPVRIAHELSRNRRRAIQKALTEHQVEDRAEWDRGSEWSDYRFYRKLVKKGTIRTIELPLLEVTIGDPWSTSVTIIHGKRPGPTITILGGMHGDELTGPSACTHLLSTALLIPKSHSILKHLLEQYVSFRLSTCLATDRNLDISRMVVT